MTKPPAFQFYVKDWLTGTRRLSWAAKGAYIDLLAWSWDNGPLPLRTKEIARVIGAVANEFAKLWRELVRHWVRTPLGYVNQRLELERRKQKAFRKLQAAKGRASAEARSNRGSTDGQPEASRPGSTGGQPSFALSSASSSAGDQEPDQEQRADAPPSHAVLVKLAHIVLDRIQDEQRDPGEHETIERIKDLAARGEMTYDTGHILPALDSARAQRRARRAS